MTEAARHWLASVTAASVLLEENAGRRNASCPAGARSAHWRPELVAASHDSGGPVRSTTIASAPAERTVAASAEGSTTSQERIFKDFAMVKERGEPILNFLPLA
jgi:hypothetical protein